jgi:hypothetical protein
VARASGREIKAKKWIPEEIEVANASVIFLNFELWMSSSAKATEKNFGVLFTLLEAYFQKGKAVLLACLPSEA